MNKIFLFWGLILILNPQLSAQKPQAKNSTDKNIEELTLIWIAENEKASIPFKYLPFNFVDSLSPVRITDTFAVQYAVAEKEKMIEILKNDPGLRISGNFTQNFQPANDDFEVNGSYRRKYQAGIDWNILNDGLIQNYYTIEAYEKDIANLRLQYKNSFSTLQNPIIKKKVFAFFNSTQIDVLTQDRNMLMKMMSPAKLLELTKDFPRDDYLRLMSRRDAVNSHLLVLTSQNQQISAQKNKDSEILCLPVCDLKYDVLEASFEQKYKDSLNISERLSVGNQRKIIHEISLRPFLRYNLYESGTGISTNSFFSTGVSFSIPIPLNTKRKNELTQIRALKLKSENETQQISRKSHFEKLIFSYQDQLIRYLDNVGTLKDLTEKYRLQRTALKTDSLLFNPFEGLKTLDDIYQQKLHMLLIHQELYMLAASIYRMTAFTRFSDIFKPLEIRNYTGETEETDLSIYIWSSVFRNYSLNFIEEYLISNNIKTAMVSIGSNKAISDKATESIIRMNKLGINTQLLIGDNKLLDKDMYKYLEQKVPDNLKNIIFGIHLDVEPQTFDDWTTKKYIYIEKYISMLKGARKYCDDNHFELYVSVPLHFPNEYINQIFAMCDKVYLMAYENTDLDFIKRKSAEEFAADANKIVLAYRFKDFKTKIDLYNFIDDSKTEFKINRFALHDFSSMTAADKALLKTNK
jgi:hypothetical protein